MDIIKNNALQQFDAAKELISKLAEKCNTIVVCESTIDEAKSLAKEAKKIENIIEDKRKEITKPLLDEKKQIDEHAKTLTNTLSESITSLRNAILKYEKEAEQKRLEELRKIEEAKRKAEDELRRKEAELAAQQAKGEKVSIEAAEAIEIAKQEQQKIVQMESQSKQSSNLRKVWAFKVVDVRKVPLEYLVVNEKAVKQAIAEGTRCIPGIEIYQEEQLVIR